MDFNEKLQTLRKEKNITQEELAEKLDVSRQAVSKWESGQSLPEIDKIIELAKMHEVSLDYLLTNEKERKNFEPQKNALQTKKSNLRIIMASLLLGIGLIGMLIIYICYIVNLIAVNWRELNFIGFWSYYKLQPLVIACGILVFAGAAMLMENMIIRLITYLRQNLLLVFGSVGFCAGIFLIFSSIMSWSAPVTETMSIEDINGEFIRGYKIQSVNSNNRLVFLLIFSIILTLAALIMLITGIVKKTRKK